MKTKETETPEVIESGKVEDGGTTKWEFFEGLNIVPIRVTCQDYRPVHMSDGSCHTNVHLAGKNIVGHMQSEHGAGGGFKFELRRREGAKNPLWKELQTEKIELHDFRCDVCDVTLELQGRQILKHLQPHAGKARAPRPGGGFWMTLKFDKPDSDVQWMEDENN